MPKKYPPEFRQRALDRIDDGRTVREVAYELEVAPQTLYTWRNQHRINTGQIEGTSTHQSSELKAAKREIERLQSELAITRRANQLLKETSSPKGGSRRSM